MGYLLKCESCGYTISSADTERAIRNVAEATFSCSQCHEKQFKITERKEKSVTFEPNDDDDDDDQRGLGDY